MLATFLREDVAGTGEAAWIAELISIAETVLAQNPFGRPHPWPSGGLDRRWRHLGRGSFDISGLCTKSISSISCGGFPRGTGESGQDGR